MDDVVEPTTFGELLREHRVDAGLTQRVLAARAGLSVRGIQHLESGESQPYPHTVEQLAKVLALSAEERERFEALALPKPRRPRKRRTDLDATRPAIAAPAFGPDVFSNGTVTVVLLAIDGNLATHATPEGHAWDAVESARSLLRAFLEDGAPPRPGDRTHRDAIVSLFGTPAAPRSDLLTAASR